MTMNYENFSEILARERLPAAIVDLDAFDRNLVKVREIAAGIDPSKKIRIATKSVRVPALIARALKAGPPFSGLMTYSAGETAWLASALEAEGGGEGGACACDFLLAYPTVQPSDLQALREAHERGARVRMVVDSPAHIRAVAAAMKGAARPFPVVLEIDGSLRFLSGKVHLGVRRSPIRSVEALMQVVNELGRHSELRFGGLMLYEAQVAGLTDRNPFKPLLNPIAHFVRVLSVKRVAKLRKAVSEACARRGLALDVFNGGGTGSLRTTAREPWVSEVSVGSGLFSPHLFDYYSDIRFEPACFFALQAVRSSDPGLITCLGGGYIASGEPGWDRVPRPWLPAGSKLVGTEACGEVQTPLRLADGQTVIPGEPVIFRHAKAGELMERFNEALLVSGGKIVGREKTYRGMGFSFF
ncbi:MAG: alanine racemase, partial [Deltaproteobacteria bacterium]|nr:alanine racemase [Deltaproteobacteria bacterium]